MGFEFLDCDGSPIPAPIAEFLSAQLGYQADRPVPVPPSRILVIEDNQLHRNRIVSVAARAGHKVTAVTGALEGLREALKSTPDLILSDVEMPNMDGFQLARLIRARPNLASVPLVLFTALDGDRDRLMGYRIGVDDYISKSLSDAELLTRIERVLVRANVNPRNVASRRVLRGDLVQVSPSSLLSFLELERRTGHLLIVADESVATLHLREGAVVRVALSPEPEGLVGMARVFHILDWTSGWFELSEAEVTCEDQIGAPTSFVLLEHARKHDEESEL